MPTVIPAQAGIRQFFGKSAAGPSMTLQGSDC